MAENSLEQKPSETALFAALRRSIANKEYDGKQLGPDYLAELFLPPHFRFFLKFEKIRENTKDRLNNFFPGLNEYMIARTVFFDKLFSEALINKTPQIVLLGAGYDTRAYRFAQLIQNTKIFELDIAPTQNRKKQLLKKARVNIPSNVTFVPINFNQDSLKHVLDGAGCKIEQKTLYIWEGVSYYLNCDSVDKTLEFISSSPHKESRIAFDYTISLSKENLDTFYGAKEFAQSMKEHHTDEKLLFSINDREIKSYLEQRNLKLVEHLNNVDIEELFLKDENGTKIGPMTGHFRFMVASPL